MLREGAQGGRQREAGSLRARAGRPKRARGVRRRRRGRPRRRSRPWRAPRGRAPRPSATRGSGSRYAREEQRLRVRRARGSAGRRGALLRERGQEPRSEARGGLAGMAGEEDDVAGPGARARQRSAGRPAPERDRDDRQRRGREVAADERARRTSPPRCDRAARDRERELLAALRRNADGEQEDLGLRSHRGEVREVDGHRPAPEPLGVLARQEVDVLDEHVRRRGEQARRPVEQRGVVAGPDEDAVAARAAARASRSTNRSSAFTRAGAVGRPAPGRTR